MIGIGEGQTRPRRKWHLRNDSRRIYMSLSVDIVPQIAMVLSGFEAIHPFVDGNDAVGTVPDAGEIEIKIKVTNRWPNRLIGDAGLPDDCEWDDGKKSKGYPLIKSWPGWLLRGEPSPTGRHAFSTCSLWDADEPLLESGLLGPVRFSQE